MISVIMVQHNNARLTTEAVGSLLRHHPGGCEVIVVDNASTDPDAGEVQQRFSRIVFMRNGTNVGFGGANNLGAKAARGEILLFLNNDTIVNSPILGHVESELCGRADVGALGPRLLYPDGTFQLSAGWLPSFWKEIGDKFVYSMERRRQGPFLRYLASRYREPRPVGWVTGAALFIRKALFEQLGGFDDRMFMFYEDKDLCCRVWQSGYSVLYDPRVSLVHLKGGSSTVSISSDLKRIYRNSQRLYYGKHRPSLEQRLLDLYLSVKGTHRNG